MGYIQPKSTEGQEMKLEVKIELDEWSQLPDNLFDDLMYWLQRDSIVGDVDDSGLLELTFEYNMEYSICKRLPIKVDIEELASTIVGCLKQDIEAGEEHSCWLPGLIALKEKMQRSISEIEKVTNATK